LLDWINSSQAAKIKYEELKKYWSNIHFSSRSTKLVSQKETRDMIWGKAFKAKEL